MLFLDEPTIGLDIEAKAAVRAFLWELNRAEGTTVILTTHDLDDITAAGSGSPANAADGSGPLHAGHAISAPPPSPPAFGIRNHIEPPADRHRPWPGIYDGTIDALHAAYGSTRMLVADLGGPHHNPHPGTGWAGAQVVRAEGHRRWIRFVDIDADRIGDWKAKMIAEGLAAQTINAYLSLLGTILNAAVDSDYLPRSPMRRKSGAGRVQAAKNQRTARREVWLTRAQLDRLASAINPRYRALVLAAALTGLRWGELIALRWDGTYRVLRGGGWFDERWSCRASVRRRSHPTFQIDDVGFRIARSILR